MQISKSKDMLSLVDLYDYHAITGVHNSEEKIILSDCVNSFPELGDFTFLLFENKQYPMIQSSRESDIFFLFNCYNIENAHFGFKNELKEALERGYQQELILSDVLMISDKPYITLTKKGTYYDDYIKNNHIKRRVKLFDFPFNINVFFKMRSECCDDYGLVLQKNNSIYIGGKKYKMNIYFIILRNKQSDPIYCNIEEDRVCRAFIHITIKNPHDKYYRGYDYIILD